MRLLQILALTVIMMIAGLTCATSNCAFSGGHQDDLASACEVFKNTSSADLLQYLTGVVPDEKNAECVTFAIRKMGKDRYELATTVLVKLLDFRRPQTAAEKKGFFERPQIIEEVFPASAALELIGESTLPEVLRAIGSVSISETARENAIAVWMETYKYDRPKGVFRLKQEEAKAHNDAVKQKLTWAVQKALIYCGPRTDEKGAACLQAAKASAP